ncbi:MAG TPA: hypothetical protein VH120_11400 [Gemmataceae bacterium]|nr:hypothetical protein [Gemmataceae bacterium]
MLQSLRMVVIILAAAPCGCAANAVRPPNPTARIPGEELEAREPAPPNERYFVLVFGSQSQPLRPKYTHSWVTAVRVTDQGPGQPPVVEAHTISWMPATLDIHPLRFTVEPGVDLDLCTTVREMRKYDERISLWGPYEVRRGLYLKLRLQKDFMDGGTVGYQTIDSVGEARHGAGCDCIHAVTDCDSKFDRTEYPLSRFGDRGSEQMVRQIMERRFVINPCAAHDWLLGPLGIADCPIVKRTYDPSRRHK